MFIYVIERSERGDGKALRFSSIQSDFLYTCRKLPLTLPVITEIKINGTYRLEIMFQGGISYAKK